MLGLSTTKGKCLLDPNPQKRDKRLFDDGIGALHKFVEAYMGEAALAADPTLGKTARPPRMLAQCGGIVVKHIYFQLL